jgi:UDP-N-acetylglucosamine 2-epimerase (hydrolysing)
VTGTRADFGKIEPLARVVADAGFGVSFFITGMHMMARYGETRLEVKRFQGAEFFEFVNQREGDGLDFILAKTVTGFSDFVHEHRPDLVVIHGDRVEALAASIVCALRYIPSAHIEGGEVSGTIDESIRHCNSKLCAAHFVSSEFARQRVMSLGEPPERIFVVGSPELDMHARPSGVAFVDVLAYYKIPFKDFGVVIFHPVVSESETMGVQAAALFSALNQSGRNFVVIAPNNDPGTQQIFSEIAKLPADRFRLLPSMRFAYFSELLKNAAVFIGNSSVGVREAPFLGLPSLNIGTRQHNRAESDSVSHANAFDKEAVHRFIEIHWAKRMAPSYEYGSGRAATRFLEVLTSEPFWALPKQKVFTD